MMPQLQSDLIQALKQGESLKVSVIRMLISELNYRKIEVQRDLSDDDVLTVLGREIKKRREAIESFSAGGRADQAKTEQQELDILLKYQPKQMGEAEIRASLSEMDELSGVTEFGSAMKIVAPVFKGKTDGSLVARLVKELIATRA